MLFQQRVAQGNQLHLFIPPAIAIHHAHVAVVTGDVLLQNQVIFVGGTIDGVQNSFEFLAVIRHKDLFLILEMAVPIRHRIARLDNHREIKGEFHTLIILVRTGRRFGECKSMLLTDLVEALFDAQPHQKRLVDALKAVIGAQLVLVAHQQLDIIVATGHQQERLVWVAPREVDQRLAEDRVVLQIGFHALHGDNRAIGGRV